MLSQFFRVRALFGTHEHLPLLFNFKKSHTVVNMNEYLYI